MKTEKRKIRAEVNRQDTFGKKEKFLCKRNDCLKPTAQHSSKSFI
jgi:hypothetical protein